MGSDIFKTIIERKIDIFANTFGTDSNSIFKINDKLFHPLEYGMYREKAFKELLEFVIDKDVSITDGFVITSQNNISTQCDIIIYESNVIPLIDNNIAKFFPVEIVKGIGEIKSNLSKTKFKETLQKLAKNKQLSLERTRFSERKILCEEYDYITTFLVCNKLDFDITSIDFDEIYEDIPKHFWHNAILSLDDGILTYLLFYDILPDAIKQKLSYLFRGREAIAWGHPLLILDNTIIGCKPNFSEITIENKYNHILHFLEKIKTNLIFQPQYKFDFVTYLNL